jgi:rubrerythrin
MPARFKCTNCGTGFDAAEETPDKCPSCGAADPAPQIKSEILVRSLEVD